MIMIDAFGTIALVAMTPTISIQVVGLMYKIKLRHSEAVAEEAEIAVIDTPVENIQSSAPAAAVEQPKIAIVAEAFDDSDIEIIDLPNDYDDLTEDREEDLSQTING
jgi:hypothetical protein